MSFIRFDNPGIGGSLKSISVITIRDKGKFYFSVSLLKAAEIQDKKKAYVVFFWSKETRQIGMQFSVEPSAGDYSLTIQKNALSGKLKGGIVTAVDFMKMTGLPLKGRTMVPVHLDAETNLFITEPITKQWRFIKKGNRKIKEVI